MTMRAFVFLAISGVLFSSMVEAKQLSIVDTARSEVVSPGTRVVAGNSHQNEFYILSQHDALKVAEMRSTITKTLRQTSKQHRIAAIKSKSKVQVALKKRH